VATLLHCTGFVEETLSKLSAIRCGAEELVGITRDRMILRLTWLKCLLRFNVMNFTDRRAFERVTNALEHLRLDDSNGSVRKQPYCVLLTGYPGCGKSQYALRLAASCLKAKYGRAKASDVVVLNETDEFQSEYRSSHKVVIFDDIGAEKPDRATINPWRKIIDFANNVRKTSLNPNVEMKGNVYIHPDMLIITTNLAPGAQVQHYMNVPSAIYRRMSKVLFLVDDGTYTLAKEVNPTINKQPRLGSLFGYDYTYHMPTETQPRKDLTKKIVSEFLRNDQAQEYFVRETNSILDEDEPKTVLGAFYEDIIRPYWPKKIPLDRVDEDKLSLYHRFVRYFCIEDTHAIVCMSGTHVEYPSYRDYEPPKDTLRRFLLDRVDWEFYEVVRHELLGVRYAHKTAFQTDNRLISWDVSHCPYTTSGVECTFQDLEEAFTIHKRKRDVDPLPEISTYWIQPYRRNKTKLEVDDLPRLVNWMNKDLSQSNLGQLRPQDPMLIVQYLLALRAHTCSFACLGVEYEINNLTPDVLMKSGDTYIVFECKNSTNAMGTAQIRKYLYSFHQTGDFAVAVLFTQYDVKVYAVEKVQPGLLGNIKKLVIQVLSELSEKSQVFRTKHFKNNDCCGAVGPSSTDDESSDSS
jgi:hypothetical protein